MYKVWPSEFSPRAQRVFCCSFHSHNIMTRSPLFFLLLDTEHLWKLSFDGTPPFRSTELWARGKDVQRALSYLSEAGESIGFGGDEVLDSMTLLAASDWSC